ncbi:MAG: hypothetical protein WDN69_05840 [Aliidongia sp.]
MGWEIVALSAEMVSNQASVAVQGSSHDGQYSNVAVSFNFAQGHYSKRQLLEKAKRLIDEVSSVLKDEIAKSP